MIVAAVENQLSGSLNKTHNSKMPRRIVGIAHNASQMFVWIKGNSFHMTSVLFSIAWSVCGWFHTFRDAEGALQSNLINSFPAHEHLNRHLHTTQGNFYNIAYMHRFLYYNNELIFSSKKPRKMRDCQNSSFSLFWYSLKLNFKFTINPRQIDVSHPKKTSPLTCLCQGAWFITHSSSQLT